jgi:hypothetical protein
MIAVQNLFNYWRMEITNRQFLQVTVNLVRNEHAANFVCLLKVTNMLTTGTFWVTSYNFQADGIYCST